MNESNNWDSENYSKHADFVSQLALPLVDLLNPKEDEHILDLGCGDGTLALEIQKYNAKVIGVDLSADMVKKANARGIESFVKSATHLEYKNKFHAVFSNAVLHWVKEPIVAIKEIHAALKPNGRFVAEFGGYGNIQKLTTAMSDVFDKHKKYGEFKNPWYFPKEAQYKNLLEKNGFKVEYIELIKRPTPIDDIAKWLDIFANGIIESLNEEKKISFKNEVKEILKHELYTKKDAWQVDYVRLRLKATKV